MMMLLLLFFYPREQRFQGKTFSQSLRGFSHDGYQLGTEPPYSPVGVFSPSTERSQATDALEHFGKPDVAALVRLAGAKHSMLSPIWVWMSGKLPFLKLQYSTASEKQSQAVAAFIHYGSRSAPAVPALLTLLQDERTARPALYALAFVGSDAERQVPALTNFLIHAHPSYLQMDAMATLGELGQKAREAQPVLSLRLMSTNDYVSAMAAVTLSRVGARSPRLAALITHRLASATAQRGYTASPAEMYLWAIGNLGSGAKDSITVIAQFTNSPAMQVRQRAGEAIEKIAKAVGQGIEPDASPSGGPAVPSANSGVAEGRHR